MSCHLVRYQCEMLLINRWMAVYNKSLSGQAGGLGPGWAVCRRARYTPEEENREIARLFVLTGNYIWADAFKWRMFCLGADQAMAARQLHGGGNGTR